MIKEEILDLARTYEEALMGNNLTRAEMVMLLALIDARVKAKLQQLPSNPTPAPVVVGKDSTGDVPENMKVRETTAKKSVAYDNMYDPPPPFDVDKPPPQGTGTGAILASKNSACMCNSCGKIIYMINRDIPDNCKVDYFIESFTPIEPAPKMTKKIEIMNVDGQISTDCPLCKGGKTLYLTGKK